jgi:hypothetical protein
LAHCPLPPRPFVTGSAPKLRPPSLLADLLCSTPISMHACCGLGRSDELLGVVPIVIDIEHTEPVIASAVSACRRLAVECGNAAGQTASREHYLPRRDALVARPVPSSVRVRESHGDEERWDYCECRARGTGRE